MVVVSGSSIQEKEDWARVERVGIAAGRLSWVRRSDWGSGFGEGLGWVVG